MAKKQIILLDPQSVHKTKKNGKDDYELLDLQVKVETFKKICDVVDKEFYQKIEGKMPYCFQLNDFTNMLIQEYIERAQLYDFRATERRMIMMCVAFILISEIIKDASLNMQSGETLHKAIEFFYKELNNPNNISIKKIKKRFRVCFIFSSAKKLYNHYIILILS